MVFQEEGKELGVSFEGRGENIKEKNQDLPRAIGLKCGHALAELAPAKGRTVFIDEGRSNAV